MNKDTNPVILCILDGWGLRDALDFNAIKEAQPEFFNFLLEAYPNSALSASGVDVGLPIGQMGNSEVGHMTMGAGRPILQDLSRIDKDLNSSLNKPCLTKLINTLKTTNKTCHIVGLLSDGGVHSHMNHILTIAKFIAEHNGQVKLHLITDGRDTLPKSALQFISQAVECIKNNKLISIATLGGRFYAMDRDKRFERTKQAYDTIQNGKGKSFTNVDEAVMNSYATNICDEFITMHAHKNYAGMEDGDGIFFANFRADRMRQLFDSLCDPAFSGFDRQKLIKFSHIITMTPYHKKNASFADVLFEPLMPKNILSDVLYSNGLSQFRIAETEKYAHVTFFFDAAKENAYPNEKRIFINSSKVATYDLKPEMSAHEITDALIQNALSTHYDFLLLNYANTDMVGHTGNYKATLQAVKAVDDCLRKLYSCLVKDRNFSLVIVGDHGNAEYMFDEENTSPHTAHTLNPVPFIVAGKEYNKNEWQLTRGSLCDVAPTILNMMKIQKPLEMTGNNLLKRKT